MKIVNIANKGRFIYLFCREDDGKQKIILDKTFYPFYFEPDGHGEYTSYDGIKLKKVTCINPSDISKQRSSISYASDIKYTTNYCIHKIDKFELCPLKIFYLDIEIICPELPDVNNPKYPVSCITIYNSFSKEYKTFYLKDYVGDRTHQEHQLIEEVIDYFKKEKPDIWTSWNIEFDYSYLHNRFKKFAERISPIGLIRAGKGENIFFPAGISIVDQKGLYEKFTLNKKRSYALDYIAQEDLGEEAWGNTSFNDLKDDTVKYKNINDVRRMVLLEEKFKIFPYFNEVRMMSKCMWEDLPQETIRKDGRFFKVSNNSKIVDCLLLQEAKEKDVIVPKKNPGEIEEFQGAYRESFGIGTFFDLAKLDLGSAYPNAIINFCLDPSNLKTEPQENSIRIEVTDKDTRGVIGEYHYVQNEDALLPSLVKKFITIKDRLKSQLAKLEQDSEEYKNTTIKYNAIKSIVNSCYGVLGNRFFRLYDKRVAETITFLVRDLLEYTKDHLESKGKKVIYVDTDSVFIQGKENISEELNQVVKKWGIERYNNSNVNIQFDYEGYFEKILILSKCHYYGYIRSKKGVKREIKGVEIKRSSSSKYEAYFQENLIEKILNKESRANVIDWIKKEKIRIKTLPIFEVAFPSKIPMRKLLNFPIHLRAYENTQYLDKNFKLATGEMFYYIFIKSLGRLNDGKDLDVLAFKKDNYEFIDPARVDWNSIITRNIEGKADKLFEAIGWKIKGQPIVSNPLFDY